MAICCTLLFHQTNFLSLKTLWFQISILFKNCRCSCHSLWHFSLKKIADIFHPLFFSILEFLPFISVKVKLLCLIFTTPDVHFVLITYMKYSSKKNSHEISWPKKTLILGNGEMITKNHGSSSQQYVTLFFFF